MSVVLQIVRKSGVNLIRNLVVVAILASVSGTPVLAQVAADASSQVGTIIFYRGSNVVGAALGCPIRYKGQEIVELGRGKYAKWRVPAGRYILTNKTASVEVSVDADEIRYVRCMIKTGFLTGRADFQIVDEESFVANRDSYEEKEIAPLVSNLTRSVSLP